MKIVNTALLVIMILSLGCSSTATRDGAESKVIADRFYHLGPEGDFAASVGAKFNSRAEMAAFLNLEYPVGQFNGEDWVLADIMVDADFNALGDVASWTVAGPRPLVKDYILKLEKLYAAKQVFYDFSWFEVNAEPCASPEEGLDP